MVSEEILNAAPENELIRNTMKKADLSEYSTMALLQELVERAMKEDEND